MTQHTESSSYREKLIEHLFVAELLKLSWLHHCCSLEIAKPEVDNSGYDLIMEAMGVVRHIQLKTSIIGGKTAVQKVHTKLADKPSGCVVWIYIDEETLRLGPFYYFGAEAGSPLPSLVDRKVAKHTKGNKDGVKAQRQSIRVLPKGSFTKIETIGDLYTCLFSKTQPCGSEEFPDRAFELHVEVRSSQGDHVIANEDLFLDFLVHSGVGVNDVAASSPASYISYLNSVAKLIDSDITPMLLRSEDDVRNIAEKISGKREKNTIRNYCSAMRQYVAMVKAKGL
jgi:hypothetical protein